MRTLPERVKVATSAEQVDPINEEATKAEDEAYVKALVELRQWFELWSRIARVTVKRRDYLIQMGLAHRKNPTKEERDPVVS